jgi:tetratricopeptide (TPR) repeat protein
MNAGFFTADQIVHDRYLYLPLLGILMLVVPFAAEFLKEKNTLIAAAVICLPLCFQTFTYNTAWANELALWAWSSKVDNSAFTMMQYGSVLNQKGRNDEAIKAYTDSINARPMARNYLGRGRTYLEKNQYAEAEKDLTTVLQMPLENLEAYAMYQTYEALGISYSEQKKYDEAIASFSEAKRKLPIYAAALAVNLAIVRYQKGDKDQAINELESARAQARKELLPESKAVFLRLGMLYAEQERKEEARATLREFLKLTETFKDNESVADRATANKTLQSLDQPRQQTITIPLK